MGMGILVYSSDTHIDFISGEDDDIHSSASIPQINGTQLPCLS